MYSAIGKVNITPLKSKNFPTPESCQYSRKESRQEYGTGRRGEPALPSCTSDYQIERENGLPFSLFYL
jgi:hypothetical protein